MSSSLAGQAEVTVECHAIPFKDTWIQDADTVTLTRHGRGVFKGWKTTVCPDHPPDHWPTTSRGGLHTCGNRPGSSPALTCRWQLLPLPCHWVSVTPLVVPICCTNSPAHLIWSFRPWAVWGFQWFHLWGVSPEEMACGTAAISAPIIAASVCCSVGPCLLALPHCGSTELKHSVFSLLHWHH